MLTPGNRRGLLADRGDDFYQTPRPLTLAMLAALNIPPHLHLWEPCAGRNAITDVLRERSYRVTASDKVDRGCPLDFVADFLALKQAPGGVDAIVTNPPYGRRADAFVEHALELCPNVVMLLRLAFCAGHNPRRCRAVDEGGLAKVCVLRKRPDGMHRESWTGNKADLQADLAWFRWRRGYAGPVILERIDWRPFAERAA